MQLLIANDEGEATPPLERALLEIAVELRYLLEHGDPEQNARRVQTWAVIEQRTFLLESGYAPGSSECKVLEDALELRSRLHPEIVSEMEGNRRGKGGKRKHWTGLSRVDLLTAVLGPQAKRWYGILSWDAHPVITSHRDTASDEDDPIVLRFKPAEWEYQMKEKVASRVGLHIASIWQTYSLTFGIPLLSTAASVRLRPIRTLAERRMSGRDG